MKNLIILLVCLSFIRYSNGQESSFSLNDSCSYVLIPSIIVDCEFDIKSGWYQSARLEIEQLYNECPFDSVKLIAYDTINSSVDTAFSLSSTRKQLNPSKNECWYVQFMPAKISIYQNGKLVQQDSLTVSLSISENSKKCSCGSGQEITGNFDGTAFSKKTFKKNRKRKKAEKIRLNKKKYSSKVIEHNHDGDKVERVDHLSKVRGKIYIDESFISTGFSRNNFFPEAKYEVLINSKEKDLVVLMAKCSREDGDLLVWHVVIQSGEINITARWYESGELKTTYFVHSK